MSPNLFWIPGPWRGRLAIAARPRGGDWLEDETKGWQRANLDVIVSLLEDHEAAALGLVNEAQAARASGLCFTSFPIADRGVPGSVSAANSLIASLIDALEEGKNVAVHCRQGLGRSGLIAAGILVTSGLTPERAIEVVSSARGQSVPETGEQRSWIQGLPVRPPVAVR
jgi:protein-tyrosine phosphatase